MLYAFFPGSAQAGEAVKTRAAASKAPAQVQPKSSVTVFFNPETPAESEPGPVTAPVIAPKIPIRPSAPPPADPETVSPKTPIGPPPQAATATVVPPPPKAKARPAPATVTAAEPEDLFWNLWILDLWKKSNARLGLGFNVGYLASFGPGDRYLYAPAFMLEALVRIPLNKSSFLIPIEMYSVSAGLESGYYGSSAEETRGQDDEIRGEYQVTQDLHVVPLYLNIYFDLPVTELLSVSFGTGLGASFAWIHSGYHTPFYSNENEGYESISSASFSYQFIGRCRYKTGSVGEAILELRDQQASFSNSGSEGDLDGLSLGIGYIFLF